MKPQHRNLTFIVAAAVLVIVSSVTLLSLLRSAPPDFSQWPAGEERKREFLGFFAPLVTHANMLIDDDRKTLQILRDDGELSWWQQRKLQTLAEAYRLDSQDMSNTDIVSELLLRIDTLPSSLVLAQAAKESGWGTARFAVEGSNYFGQRCWEPGCGMLPRNRAPGMKFEVARYSSPTDSINSYLRNLNTHPEYQALRAYRAQLRAAGRTPTGTELATALGTYSERQQAYSNDIQKLITANNLEQSP